MKPSHKQGWKPKPKPINPVLKEIFETQTETDTYSAKTETETKTCLEFSKVLGFKNCHYHHYQNSSSNAERQIEKL